MANDSYDTVYILSKKQLKCENCLKQLVTKERQICTLQMFIYRRAAVLLFWKDSFDYACQTIWSRWIGTKTMWCSGLELLHDFWDFHVNYVTICNLHFFKAVLYSFFSSRVPSLTFAYEWVSAKTKKSSPRHWDI